MQVYVSSGAFGTRDLTSTLDQARDWGINKVELTAGLVPIADPLPALQSANNMQFLIHNYFPAPINPFVLNLASEHWNTLERSRTHCREAIKMSGKIGAPCFSVHAGFAASLSPHHLGRGIPAECATDRDKAEAIFEESIFELIPVARSAGVKLCIENNVVTSGNLVNGENRMLLLATAAELVDFIKKINSPWVNLLIDVGHVKVTCETLRIDPHQFLDETAPYTEMLHLSDNDGLADTNGTFDESSWFIYDMKKFNCSAAVVEAYNLDRDSIKTCMTTIEMAG